MSARQSFLISLLAAIVGGVAAVGVGSWAGWLSGSAAPLAVEAPVLPPVETAAVLPPGAFDPARIYRLGSSGVVTIDAVFADASAANSQGSGFVVSSDGTILTSATSSPTRAAARRARRCALRHGSSSSSTTATGSPPPSSAGTSSRTSAWSESTRGSMH